MTLSAEDAIHRFQAMEARYNELAQRLVVSEQEHLSTHEQFTKIKAESVTGHGQGKYQFRLIDPKSMAPEKFGGKNGPQWQLWSHTTKEYVGMLSQELATGLSEAEGNENHLPPDAVTRVGANAQDDNQLGKFLLIKTEGIAHSIVKAAQKEKVSGLEQWRRLSREFDLKGLGSDLLELQELTSPDKLRAKTVHGISAAIQGWEDLERRHLERQSLVLPEKLRLSILLKLAPVALTQEILNQTTKWTSYTQLKEHLHQVQFLRTTGPAPMLSSLEEGEEITLEDSEILRL